MNECKVNVASIHSEFITPEKKKKKLSHLDGLLVAPGFGYRGVEGKITAVHMHGNSLPFWNCLGMQRLL